MIAIRVDANNVIATGHLVRCMSIAVELKDLGEEVIFITSDNYAENIIGGRFSKIILDSDWKDKNVELPLLIQIIKDNNIDKMLIDSYQVTNRYLSEIRKYTKTIYIDDTDAFKYNVDVLICYACYYKKYKYEERYMDTTLLLGGKFVPLRKEFSHIRTRAIKSVINEMLIMSGGTDPYNSIGEILSGIDITRYKKINVICGRYNERYDELLRQYAGTNVSIIKSTDKIIDYMLSADVAISAAGVTLYELCACGTPTISYVIADNQIDNAIQFDEDGVISYMGDVRKDNVVNNIKVKLGKYDEVSRRQQNEKMRAYVSCDGAANIAKVIVDM